MGTHIQILDNLMKFWCEANLLGKIPIASRFVFFLAQDKGYPACWQVRLAGLASRASLARLAGPDFCPRGFRAAQVLAHTHRDLKGIKNTFYSFRDFLVAFITFSFL